MGRNAKGSVWVSTPRALRNRKPIAITLSDEARAALVVLADVAGKSRSEVVEELITKEIKRTRR